MRTGALLSALVPAAHAVQYGDNHVTVRRDSPQVESNFADPGVQLLSPWVLDNQSWPILRGFHNGTDSPTSHASMDYYLRTLDLRNYWMNYFSAEYLSQEGRSFPYVYLSTSSQPWTSSEPWYTSQPWSQRSNDTRSKVRVWLQGGVHGKEPAGDQAIMAFLGKLDANQTWAASLLHNVDIMILTRYNPDGVSYFQRTLATNYDPNRDHTKLARQQTRDIKKTFSRFAPHVAADMHEYTASALYGGSYLPGADALFSAAKNLNIDEGIRRMSEELFAPAIGASVESYGLRWEPYVTGASSNVTNSTITYYEAGSDAKIGRNAMGLSQAIVFLCETRGIGLADQEFPRRVTTGLAMIEGIVQTASDHAYDVIRVVESGIETFVNSTDSIIVTDGTSRTTRQWTFVEYESGNLVQAPVEFYSSTPTTANLTRQRPEAYLIPRAWTDLVDRLKSSGLEVQKLPYSYRDVVEALTITNATLSSQYYEGTVLSSVTTRSDSIYVELPAGSFWVTTRQKNAALAFVALEPENIDSYVSFNIIPMEVGDEYPIYRVMP
ncbi:Carboxypeptidase 2 [Fulvia fulva]|uniref:Carboxypeptidase 2 n=1 Tax=Passalora fulva TaxID=5499 RepID=A0A9Q8UQ92_PASFU|nr:Carboxypeptidase 2 [Fulvia fulva]KAK4621514.1 Carboxypeptidase 2 [Fulvia fulva]KAK4623412.1 Carboxypeptidase 2 [Fulvia fulva]UJO18612.1 Carboxypeptidase 2 [Fulvia fulva]WPV16214.1 Carboxypeptidase 2 [Fulvia fulva]WPV31035.1 Carboxypeptidase 2 [Fulvia fulva]